MITGCVKEMRIPGIFSLLIHPCMIYNNDLKFLEILVSNWNDKKSKIKEHFMPQAKEGDTVRIHYTGKFDDGTVFDSSSENEPLEFVIGDGQVIPGVEEAVIGMNPEENKTTTIPPEKGYGQYHEDMVVEVEKDKFPEHIQPELGLELELKQEDGNSVFVIVTNVSDDEVTLDANHPLAGKDLTFDIRLMEIV